MKSLCAAVLPPPGNDAAIFRVARGAVAPGASRHRHGGGKRYRSAAGVFGGGLPNDSQEYVTYAASKDGVPPGIVVTPLSSTMKIDTSILPMKRIAQPAELGWPIALLCTPAASFVSGAILDVNGGMFVG
jgi:Dehydrogenases with different specificities (related to short-chain alcohol dehydrogenases)